MRFLLYVTRFHRARASSTLTGRRASLKISLDFTGTVMRMTKIIIIIPGHDDWPFSSKIRKGELHLTESVCPRDFLGELEYWGLSALHIGLVSLLVQKLCWQKSCCPIYETFLAEPCCAYTMQRAAWLLPVDDQDDQIVKKIPPNAIKKSKHKEKLCRPGKPLCGSVVGNLTEEDLAASGGSRFLDRCQGVRKMMVTLQCTMG